MSLDTPNPTLRVRSGKGRQVTAGAGASGAARGIEQRTGGDISQGRIVEAHPTTAWRWVQAAVKRAEELGAIAPGKRIGEPIRCATVTPGTC